MALKKLDYMGMKFSAFYKDLLAMAKLTQADMARLTNISQTSSSRYLNDLTIPSRRTALQIIKAVASQIECDKTKFIDDNMAIYESIRLSFEESKI